MLRGLREEGTEPIIINWALNKELRALCEMRFDIDKGDNVSRVTANAGVWRNRIAMIENVLTRHSSKILREQFKNTVKIDRIIKGAAPGDAWDEMELLCMALASR